LGNCHSMPRHRLSNKKKKKRRRIGWLGNRWHHVTLKVNVATLIYLKDFVSQKQFKLAGRCQWNTYRKPHAVSLIVTWPAMSRDPEGQCRNLDIFMTSQKQFKLASCCQWRICWKSRTVSQMVTWPISSCDLTAKCLSRCIWGLIISTKVWTATMGQIPRSTECILVVYIPLLVSFISLHCCMSCIRAAWEMVS